jgi:hypothetical protein
MTFERHSFRLCHTWLLGFIFIFKLCTRSLMCTVKLKVGSAGLFKSVSCLWRQAYKGAWQRYQFSFRRYLWTKCHKGDWCRYIGWIAVKHMIELLWTSQETVISHGYKRVWVKKLLLLFPLFLILASRLVWKIWCCGYTLQERGWAVSWKQLASWHSQGTLATLRPCQ